MKNNTTTNTTKSTNKTMAQKVHEVAHKEIFMKKVDRDIFARSVLITSLGINLATFIAVVLFISGARF
jgi:hypothetical protein